MNARIFVAMGLCVFVITASAPRANADDDDPVVQGKKVSEWIADFKSGKYDKLYPAVSALRAAGPKAKAAVPVLIDAMRKGGDAGYMAGDALESIGPAAVPALLEAAKDKNENLKNRAIRILRSKYPEDSKKAGYGAVADEIAEMKKLPATKDLKNTGWYSVGGAYSTGFITGSSGDGSKNIDVSFAAEKATWKKMSLFFTKAGEGTFKTDTTAEPARIEITMNGKSYKGIYEVKKSKDAPVSMTMLLNEAGADYPKAFGANSFSLPMGSKGTLLLLVRAK
jgi:hypothetical protein